MDKAIGTIEPVTRKFDDQLSIPTESGKHTAKTADKDFHKLLKEISELHVIQYKKGKTHNSFNDLAIPLLDKIDDTTFAQWSKEHSSAIINS